MNRKRLIRKLLIALFWLLAGAGMVTLLVAANRRGQGHVVREVRIRIKGDGEQFFVDKGDILQMLTFAHRKPLAGSAFESLNLARLEEALERGIWIRQAELYIDSRDVLHVQVAEREPVARVFTTEGRSFYLDSAGKQLPLLEKESARVLLVTNYPGALQNRQDSLRADEVRRMATRIHGDPFWHEQLSQIDLLPDGSYEAIPVLGNHIVRLGNADALESKLKRLLLFYRKVLAQTGFDKYAAVDLRFDGQVVGVQRGPVSKVDSIQLQKNIAELLLRAQQQLTQDSLAAVEQLNEAAERANRPRISLDSAGMLPDEPDTARRIPTPVAPRPAATVPAAANRQGALNPGATNPPAANRVVHSTATPPKQVVPAVTQARATTARRNPKAVMNPSASGGQRRAQQPMPARRATGNEY